MKKIKFLYITIIVLVLLNVCTLLFFHLNRPEGGGNGPNSPKNIVIEKLHFDQTQTVAYEKLISVHFDKIQALDRVIRDAKKKLYSNLSKSQNTTSNDSLYNVIAKSQAEIEMIHYKHFLDIRNICKPEQMTDFIKLSNELTQLFGVPKGPRK